MVRRGIAVFAVLVTLMLFTAVSASAASPHFKKGGTPTCTITGSGSSQTVVCGATLAGLGNGDLTVDVTVSGFAVSDRAVPSVSVHVVVSDGKVLVAMQEPACKV